MKVEYPARVVKHGTAMYVKVGVDIRKILDIDRNDYVTVSIEKLPVENTKEKETGLWRTWTADYSITDGVDSVFSCSQFRPKLVTVGVVV